MSQDPEVSSNPSPDLTADTLNAACALASQGLLSRFKPRSGQFQQKIQDLNDQQVELVDRVEAEKDKFEKGLEDFPLSEMISRTQSYHGKLLDLQREMKAMSERSQGMKARALRLQELKQAEALTRVNRLQREADKEEQLIAKPAQQS
ncbi:biogenesis of lysosome-related organelles complex 1 subunit 6-like [Tigriopus californicus]|uniref:biogenesis of lysosome-related organelles complex 1 subunit 6-like n=1 Tax=Tigriopus californicus TaxID=6832 RepID=UPI0027DA4E12|nr:biogenesis of lysosome-related organelles complex 1 subunit 6-like [Tigriopus californicus]